MKEDGVMRVGGRISMAPITADAKNPMILPNDHHVTTILIRNIHEVNGHCGVEQVLSISREQFWIVKARATILKEVCPLPKTDGPEDASADGTVAQSTINPIRATVHLLRGGLFRTISGEARKRASN